MAGLVLVAVGADRARLLITPARAMLGVNRTAAGMMAGADAWLLAKS